MASCTAAELIKARHRQEMVAHMSLGFDLGNGGFDDALGLLDEMRDRMLPLLYQGDHVTLPPLALGAAGEWPARHDYNGIWDSLRAQLRAGVDAADDLSDRVLDSARALTAAETAAQQTVLDAVAKSRAAGGKPPADEDTWKSDAEKEEEKLRYYDRPIWQLFGDELGSVAVGAAPWLLGAAGLAAGAGTGVAAGTRWKREAAAGRWSRADKVGRLESRLGKMSAEGDRMRGRWPQAFESIVKENPNGWKRNFVEGYRYTEQDLKEARSELERWSKTTDANLKKARKFSWSAVAAGLAWAALVIPSDDALDSAVLGWRDLAWQMGETFGHDTAAVREAVLNSWQAASSSAADLRLLEFVAAGNVLTERVARLSEALATTVSALKVIHLIAMAFSMASAMGITAYGIAGRLNPQARLFAEFLGSRLTTVILAIAGLAPVAAAQGARWYAARDIDVSIKVGDREITGFKSLDTPA